MTVSVDIAFHNVEHSRNAEAEIRQQVEKLQRHYPRLIRCRVSVEALHQQHRTGNLFEVHIVMSVPGCELAVSQAPHHAKERRVHPDMIDCIKDAFRLAERRLETYKAHQRQEAPIPEDQI